MSQIKTITPNWPAPKNVQAHTTIRKGGMSRPPYSSFNLGDHVGDDLSAVLKNRRLLRQSLKLPREPIWLNQVHGVDVVDAAVLDTGGTADGAYTDQQDVVCAILTADCLPIFLCNKQGTEVALLHGGWRGLAGGIVEVGVNKFHTAPGDLLAWLGPAIGPTAFEVGDDVRQAFLSWNVGAEAAFKKNEHGRWMADIYALARMRLSAVGVGVVCGGDGCTVTQPDLFYSYRRDGATGRMASLIWLAARD